MGIMKPLYYDEVYVGVMEKKLETTIVYWGYIRIKEKWKLLTYDMVFIGAFIGIPQGCKGFI